ncbi:MAG: Gx transporter family protein [bacterium]
MNARLTSKIAMLSAAAIGAYVAESAFPMPLPWARIGISNVVVVVGLFSLGLREAMLINLVRVVIGNLIAGGLFGVGFILSICGSTVSTLAMGMLKQLVYPSLSLIGISSVGASVNNFVQIMLFGLLIGAPGVSGTMIGGFLLIGVVVGSVTGILASLVMSRLKLESP